MRTMPAVSRTGSGMNACAIYVGDLARRVESLAGSGRPLSPARVKAFMSTIARPVSSEFFEEE